MDDVYGYAELASEPGISMIALDLEACSKESHIYSHMGIRDNNDGCLPLLIAVLIIWDVIRSVFAARIIAKDGWQAFANSVWMKVTYVITAIFFVFIAVVWSIALVIWIKEKLENNNDSQDTVL